MAEVIQTFLDLKTDVKNLITVLQELNNHIGDLEKSVKVVEGLFKTFQKNEKVITKMVIELERLNNNFQLLEKIIKELK